MLKYLLHFQQTDVVCLIDFVKTNNLDASLSINRQQLPYMVLQVYQNFKQLCTVVTIEYDGHSDFII